MSSANDKHFDLIKASKEDINWILEQQAQLRSELMTFYKKDLKEIHAALSSIPSDNQDTNNSMLDDVKKYFIDQWLRSYNLITPAGIGTSEPSI